MKNYLNAKGPQQVNFEFKQRLVIALNKLADRDTYQIGVEELDKIVECLTPDGVAPFLSCILDTDSEQKIMVRKECIRLMANLVTFHEGLVAPHIGKMVTSIVKRLKDPDTVVRDACIETMAVLSSKLINDTGGLFVVLVKPLFEAMGEQNRQVQSGAALCLAKIIDNSTNPPVSILERMLTRTIKFLKNPHFMAKPAVLELNRSIIQAGGAPTQNTLSAAMSSIQEALKNSDWTTRKAASLALGDIASFGGSFIRSFKGSCIRSLESCRFDKVKPVRDTVLQALHYWKNLPSSGTSEPSEAGSSIKENFCGGEYSDLTSASDCGRNKTVIGDQIKKRIPLSVRKGCQNYAENTKQHSRAKSNKDWHIEIAVPKTKTRNDSLELEVDVSYEEEEESEGSSVSKMLERSRKEQDAAAGYEYVPMDDKQEYSSSVSNLKLVPEDLDTKCVTVSFSEDGSLVKPLVSNQQFADEEFCSEEQIYLDKIRDRNSLDSTVTESSSQFMHACCSQTAKEMVFIRKQLLEIENKQSNLMDLLQAFTRGTLESLSMIQSKVQGLEHAVDSITQNFVLDGGKYSDLSSSKCLKKIPNVASPRLSMHTPRPSVDVPNRQAPIFSKQSTEAREERSSRSSNSVTQGIEMWTNTSVSMIAKNPIRAGIPKRSGQGTRNMGPGCTGSRKSDVFSSASASASSVNSKQNGSESIRNCIRAFLCKGDLDSAYAEAICSNDERVMLELLERTGPVLESLCQKTVTAILNALVSFLLQQRFVDSLIPWWQQVVDLSSIHGPNYLVPSAKSRRELLSAIQEAVNMEFSTPADTRCFTHLALKLHRLWGKYS